MGNIFIAFLLNVCDGKYFFVRKQDFIITFAHWSAFDYSILYTNIAGIEAQIK